MVMGADGRHLVSGGNLYDKRASGNPLIRACIKRYDTALLDSLDALGFQTLLDVGCGESQVTKLMKDCFPGADIFREDLSHTTLAEHTLPGVPGACADAYCLPHRDSSVDIVTLTEVLEHLRDPKAALKEAMRVGRKGCVITVPHEPFWKLANIFRLAYVEDFGNTPGHLQHWGRRGLQRDLKEVFSRVDIIPAGLWFLAVCRR
jgi:SAM-dependent methyltransferase